MKFMLQEKSEWKMAFGLVSGPPNVRIWLDINRFNDFHLFNIHYNANNKIQIQEVG